MKTTSLVLVIAIALLVLGVAFIIFSFLASFESQTTQWLAVAQGLVSIAMGSILLYVSTVVGIKKGV